MKKLLALTMILTFSLSGCFVSSTKKKVRHAKKVYAQVKVAASAKNKKEATLEAAIAIALAAKGIKQSRPFGEAFFLFREGRQGEAARAFCKGMVRNKLKNPALVLGAMTAITILGQENKKDWRLFLDTMWRESKKCAKYYITE